ncbi:putative N-acetyltransferase [Dyadobacter sp. CECT 9623]|jgi:GNAT superfamily N-acetyltransferase|uniref:N-acetyltransferase n=1 Tax=Dyadobacter linearis TaxID=2823330 RepID=A0ABM8UNG1_9BACT|nr:MULTISPECIES: GNAT family N-acetyltransferase [unclassified Dyadobacter]MCE7060176.1 GNAT family N-acetyltransferase [Dyadobacter sp. CY343]CAG5068944.1 putative N-acetyltransferase [Dyadobacter sp. CECT 9623]
MPAFSIKHANVADIPEIISIQEKTWEPTYGEILTKEQIDYMFDKIYSPGALKEQMLGGQHFLLLLNETRPEGFASVAEEEPEKFKLHKIYVLPSTQGTGAGKFLLQEAENFVRGAGGKVLALNVNRFNKARHFYEKQGYTVTGEKDIPIGPYWMNDFILEKTL